MYTRLNRFQLVASRLQGKDGSFLDVGARDRIMSRHLPAGFRYQSAEYDPGHDFQWDLEKPIPCESDNFDYVASLDVLEHVERIHEALKELIRITRKTLYISLPNMAFLSFRIKFLRQGLIGDKYALLPNHQGDRHRWFTVYSEMNRFVDEIAGKQCGCEVKRFEVLDAYTRLDKLAVALPLPPALRTYLVVYEISKRT
jgi:SAM-dependent methyltransferase